MCTDIIIPIDFCHPPEQKLAAVRYLVNRLATHPINETSKTLECNTIKQILHNNKYDVEILNRINSKLIQKQAMKLKQRQKQNGPNLYKLDGKQNSSLSYLKTLI